MADPVWLHGAVIYQIYPRSFYDPTGNGVGTITGIIQKLDYLKGNKDALGVTAIWLSPIYRSPMADFGYDVSSYTEVDPLFGTVDDVEELVRQTHARDLKVILDFVPNHTSNQHDWFIESSSSRDNPKRDWYVWRDAQPDGSPANNWLSVFGGSAWQYSETTGQYYLHSFLAEQPDLNWDNPEVREAMKTTLRFWLDKGIDGFRMDAVDWLSKDPDLRDDPINESAGPEITDQDHGFVRHKYSREGPHLYERLNEMAAVVAEYDNRCMVVEAHPEVDDKVAGYVKYYQGVDPRISAPFNFEPIYLPWQAAAFQDYINHYQANMKSEYVPVYVLGNHDEPRLASRIGSAAARTAAMMQLLLPGMAVVYYGEELGMQNVPIAPDQVRDPFVGHGDGRDPERTPMQWDATPQAGFTTGQPWLPIADSYKDHNVVSETRNQTSFLNLYKQLIAYRNQSDIVKYGSYVTYHVKDTSQDVFAFKRVHEDGELLIVLNFSDQSQTVGLPLTSGIIELSTYMDSNATAVDSEVRLRAHEGIVIRLNT